MPITLVAPVSPPPVVYDKVHMDNIVLSAEMNNYGKVSVQARIRLYHEDPITLVKTFSVEPQNIFIEDAQVWASGLAAQGDLRGVEAANYIKLMVALLASTHTTWGASTVS